MTGRVSRVSAAKPRVCAVAGRSVRRPLRLDVWRKRPESRRAAEKALLDDTRQVRAASQGRHGGPRVCAALRAGRRPCGPASPRGRYQPVAMPFPAATMDLHTREIVGCRQR